MTCLAIVSSFALLRCGGGNESSDSLPETTSGSVRDIGNMNFSCGHGSGTYGQSKKVQYQQQSGGGCDQKVEFEEQKVSDYDVNLDCDQQTVSVKNKGADQKQETFPISGDGSVHGQLRYQSKIKGPQQIGNQNAGQECWIEYVVSFEGQADCNSNRENKIRFSTQVNFEQTNENNLAEAGVPGATPAPAHETRSGMSEASHSGEHRNPSTGDPDPIVSWTPEPGLNNGSNGGEPNPTSNPIGNPTGFPSSLPSATASTEPTSLPWPSPSVSPSPSPHPSPSLVPVVVCAVQKPCTVTSEDQDFSCPDEGDSSSRSGNNY